MRKIVRAVASLVLAVALVALAIFILKTAARSFIENLVPCQGTISLTASLRRCREPAYLQLTALFTLMIGFCVGFLAVYRLVEKKLPQTIIMNPRFRMVWSVLSLALLVLLLSMQALKWEPEFIKNRQVFTDRRPIAVVLGLFVGVAGALWEQRLLRTRRNFMREFFSAPVEERLKWRLRKQNLLLNGWFGLGIIAVFVLCASTDVAISPLLLAANVPFGFLPSTIARFRQELLSTAASGSAPTTTRETVATRKPVC